MKTTLATSCMLLLSTSLSYGQADKKVETKFMRPSVTTLFYAPTDARESSVLNTFKNLPMVSKFDDHSIVYADLKLNLPAAPDVPLSNAGAAAMKDYNAKIQEINALRESQINDYISKASNPIVAKWWNRSPEGDFDASLLSKRGSYTATDADVLADKAAAASRLEMLGESLLNKSYLVLYKISNIRTMEEVYDAADAAGAKVKGYVPAKRTEEGYQLYYTADLYKLNYNDSVSALFYQDYWSSKENHDANKAEAWGSATFPMDLVNSHNSSASATQSNDPNSAIYKIIRRKSMDELLQDLPSGIQDDAITYFTRKVEDFQLKVTVYEEHPLTAKLGSKEGLSLDQRFFIYEIQLDPKTNQQIKKRKGVARATSKISTNDSIASGETKPSVFKQQGGKKIYQGMLMVEHNDLGIIVIAGYKSNPSDLSMNGINLGLEYNISKLLGKVLESKSMPGGLYLGANITINSMTDVLPGYISAIGPMDCVTDDGKWSGSTLALDFTLSKEMYITRKGNIYLLPTITYGASNISFTKEGDQLLTDSNDETQMKAFSWSARTIQLGLGLGFNFGPRVSFLLQPMFVMKGAYQDGNKAALTQYSSEDDIAGDWQKVFINIDKSKSSLPINLNLKIRL
jgi:hypothetical protein